MSTLHPTAHTLLPRARTQASPSLYERAAETLRTWAERVRSRDGLGELDDHMLKDIGMTRADIVVERSKYFWER